MEKNIKQQIEELEQQIADLKKKLDEKKKIARNVFGRYDAGGLMDVNVKA